MFIAFGAALQERVVVSTPAAAGQIRFLLRLATRPRWILGAVCAGGGVALHVVALSNGPVSLIQPVGTLGLLFAIVSKAILDHRRVRPTELVGSAAVIAGLAGLLLVLPHDASVPRLPLDTALALSLGTLAGLGVALGVAALRRVPDGLRVTLLATTAGVGFGVGSALVRVIGHRTLRDFSALFDWPTLLVIALLATGGIAQQQSYRMRRFSVAFALLLITDPVAASAVGMLVLGEPLPSTAVKVAWMGVSAAVIVTGVLVLARSYTSEPSTSEKSRTCVS
ncbi:hypothetical protein BAY60_22480 [Prauserella muralis]|uniref:Magnesium transporter NIPA n=2 Tax=Prauserella muralis TaxID=588067 RepID=A0A2V4AQR9_9PSEU|nr:hypothetical protein BAY60_22480 [Prauserella muralis]